MKLKDEIIGKTYGHLTVKDFLKYDNKHYYYNCLCSCGKTHITTRNNLLKGNTHRCPDCSRKNNPSLIKKHKYTYNSYRSMLLRCSQNLLYLNTPICERWLDKEKGFEHFLEDMGPRIENTTIDRIDNSLGYFKENCRWATASVQNHNKSKRCDSIGRYIGVSYNRGRYVVQLMQNGKRVNCKSFYSEFDAATYYDNISESLYGDRPNKTERRDVFIPTRTFGSISFCKKSKKYRVRVTDCFGKRKTIGYFVSKDEAQEVLDLIKTLHHTNI